MRPPRLFARNSAIVFDVGASGISVCQLRRRGRRCVLNDALHVAAARSESVDADAPLAPDCARLARLVGQGRFSGRDVSLVLSPPEVHFQALHVPDNVLDCSPKRVEEALAWEIARETRAEPGDLEVRYWRLPPGHREGLNVMSVALPTSQARQWVDDFADRELTLRRLDVSPCALARVAVELFRPRADQVWGVLDIGHRRTILATLVGPTPVYIRSAPVAAHQWTERIAQTFDVPYAEAEQIKRSHGIAACEQSPSGAASGPRGGRDDQRTTPVQRGADIASVTFGVLRESLDRLVHAVNLCLTYALESYADRTMTRLFLAGGGSQLAGLPEFLETYLDVPVSRLDVSADAFSTARISSERNGGVHSSAMPAPSESAAAFGASMLDLEVA